MEFYLKQSIGSWVIECWKINVDHSKLNLFEYVLMFEFL